MKTRNGLEPRTQGVECVDIVMAVAECSGVSATDLSPPLSAVVDPDALDTLLADHPARGSLLQITFDYAGCHVAVGSDGTLDVRRNAAAPS